MIVVHINLKISKLALKKHLSHSFSAKTRCEFLSVGISRLQLLDLSAAGLLKKTGFSRLAANRPQRHKKSQHRAKFIFPGTHKENLFLLQNYINFGKSVAYKSFDFDALIFL